jgi:anhydro-N-acetylmuramic acid kinase
LLFNEYDAFLNLGGISNITLKNENKITAFDISPCNQWLNKLAQTIGKSFANWA